MTIDTGAFIFFDTGYDGTSTVLGSVANAAIIKAGRETTGDWAIAADRRGYLSFATNLLFF